MLSSLFDEYTLNARVRPALLALVSLTAFIYLTFPELYNVIAAATSIIVVFGVLTALAHYCRSAGRSKEVELYACWGGRPTTMLLRHRNESIDPITKDRYHDFLERAIESWAAPTPSEELDDPANADHKYDSAVRWLLERTRDTEKYPLIFKENISYGFRRNCLGIKWLAVATSLAPVVLVAIDYAVQEVDLVDLGAPATLASISLSLLVACWWIFVVREHWVRDAATAYAFRLLAACDSSSNAKKA